LKLHSVIVGARFALRCERAVARATHGGNAPSIRKSKTRRAMPGGS
jgi:hypothetical protein